MNIRAWLRRHPHPHKVRTDAGKEILIGDGRSKWADAEASIALLAPSSIEALDKDGSILRVCNCAPDGELVDTNPEQTREAAAQKTARETEFVTIAKLLNDAHDAGAKRHAEAYRESWDKLYDLVKTIADRLTSVERLYHREIDEKAKAVADAIANAIPADADADMDQVVKAMVVQALTNQGAAAKPNGNGHAKPNGNGNGAKK
jgi:hypothetical protein